MKLIFTKRLRWSAIMLGLLLTSLGLPVAADTFNVTQTTDGTATSQLRGAILAADALGGGPHTINLAAGTYDLTLGPIVFGTQAENISIVGAGAGSTVINMTTTMQDRIFLINPPGTIHDVQVSISGIRFTNGKNPADHYGGGGILCGGPGNAISITNCAFENNMTNFLGGGALAMSGGGTMTVENCTFTNNAVLIDASSDGGTGGAISIDYFGSGSDPVAGGVTISNCVFSNNTVNASFATSGGAIGLKASYSAASPSFYTKIEKNRFIGNSVGASVSGGEGGAISISSSFVADIQYNAFAGNTIDGTTKEALSIRKFSDGAINATNNWWSCNTDPQAGGTCSEAARIVGAVGGGTLTTSPWLVLKPAVTNAVLCVGSQTQTQVAASFLTNSAGGAVSVGNLTAVLGLPVSFSAVNGSMSSAQSTIQADGRATAIYTTSGLGNGSVNVMAGYLTSGDANARASILTGTAPSIGTHPVKITTCAGSSSVAFSVAATSLETPTYQWYRGNTPLSNDGKYAGTQTATLTVHNIVAGDQGNQFKVKVTNSCGDATSNSATLNVIAGRLYVAQGSAGEGAGWDDALGSLSAALNAASGCSGITEIWVKAGTYVPTGTPYNTTLFGVRHYAFYLLDNLAIYGGFAGNETALSQRNPGLNQTILSGDLGAGGNSDNSYHTVVSVNNGPTAQLDGFIIRDGNGNGTGISPTIRGASIPATQGGGVVLYFSSAVISNCAITGNSAEQGGGVFLAGEGIAPAFRNCVMSDNAATNGSGGGVFNAYKTGATYLNCTVARNSASTQGGGVFNFLLSNPVFVNNVIWGNSASEGAGMFDQVANPTVSFSLVQGGHAGIGNLSSDVLFANQSDPNGDDNKWMTADDGLRLSLCSPAVNAGFNLVDPPIDITSQPRTFDLTTDMGAYELQSYRDGSSLSQNGDQVFQPITAGTTNGFVATGCRVIAQVTPAGGAPVSGNVRAKAFVDAGVLTAGPVKLVQRHYEILPSDNAANATARVKLFFNQSEFDAFNLEVSGAKLPSSPSDGTGVANLLVVQYHGTSATGQPGSYSGDTTTINPNDGDIVWNGSLNRWEISFDVTGFSGFFISNADPLPLKLVSFSARAVENATQMEWLTAEEVNTSHFEIHRSADARHWEMLPEQPTAMGSGGHRYYTTDNAPMAGLNYYRLKMIDLDGSFAFSQIVVAEHRNVVRMQVYPNPASTVLRIETTGSDQLTGNAELLNAQGMVMVRRKLVNGKADFPVGDLTKGLYLMRVEGNAGIPTQKVAIE
ncbi:T9SS type A sorting domain-containing protein [Dyadobacter jiangsuensis]|uniref:Putative secreted protein (Por secretion system target) n=1 Tax=Dyadobacter jiangsuensis TaxID=1591085 RepID=A0A2P8G1W4_9BACT|nr:T9SS type A sorting domain-containing protein [Dyadobacter jiangsuensis]PSL27963.1 putative secreted protein (Por secretion system target) [Dyadobacter jiangsuensis]